MRDDSKVLDVQGIMSAPLSAYTTLLAMLGTSTPMPSPVRERSPIGVLKLDLDEFEAAVALHEDQLDCRRIDAQLIGPQPLMQITALPQHCVPAYAAFVNDLIWTQCNMRPGRFVGAAQLPQDATAPDAGHMISELDRSVADLGFVAAYVCPNFDHGAQLPGLQSSWWDPLYARAAQLDIPLVIRAGALPDPRLGSLPLNFQVSFVVEHFRAKEALCRGRVFERHPELRVVVSGCGGMPERLAHDDPLRVRTEDFVGNLYFDSCAYDPGFLELVIRQKGVGAVCFGSGIPYVATRNEGTGRPGDDLVSVIDGFDWLTDAEKSAILHDNPRKLVKGFDRLL